MKPARFTLLLSIALTLAFAAHAQNAKPSDAPAATATVANPVSTVVKQQLTRFSKIMVAAAEAMPAEKYNFKPSPEMNSFAHLTNHISEGNTELCSKISGTPAPDSKLADTDSKDKLVAGLKASFDFCSTALANADDSKLSDPMSLFGGHFQTTRAGALIALSDEFFDHYSTQAVYLRLNGILPPTAQPKK
jgi:hypothetical protein